MLSALFCYWSASLGAWTGGMHSQPYSLSVRLSVAAVRHGHGGHSFETLSARGREAIEGVMAMTARELEEKMSVNEDEQQID